MTTRRATLKDLNTLSLLFDAYRVFYKQDSDIERAKTFLQDRFVNNESVIFIASKDGQDIGFTQLYPLFSSVSMQQTYVLNDLFVNNKYRGQGFGKVLLNAAKDFCEQQNAKGLTLETDVDNPAQKLYEQLDWKKDQDVLHYTWVNTRKQHE